MKGKIKTEPPTEEQYRMARINLALDYAPTIYACKKCGWPVALGYCCGSCGDINPSSKSL